MTPAGISSSPHRRVVGMYGWRQRREVWYHVSCHPRLIRCVLSTSGLLHPFFDAHLRLLTLVHFTANKLCFVRASRSLLSSGDVAQAVAFTAPVTTDDKLAVSFTCHREKTISLCDWRQHRPWTTVPGRGSDQPVVSFLLASFNKHHFAFSSMPTAMTHSPTAGPGQACPFFGLNLMPPAAVRPLWLKWLSFTGSPTLPTPGLQTYYFDMGNFTQCCKGTGLCPHLCLPAQDRTGLWLPSLFEQNLTYKSPGSESSPNEACLSF